MTDNFGGFADSTLAPSRNPYSVTPDDNTALPFVPKGLYIGVGGDVTLRGIDSSVDVIYKNLPDASYIGVRAAFVRATGTTATYIVAEA